MQPVLSIQNINLAYVDFDDFSYSISPEREIVVDAALEKSIARHGVLHPPIIREINPDSFRIVSGRKRLHAMQALHAEGTCTCLVISRQVPEIEVFHILLEETKLTGQLSPVEKALFLQKISAIMDADKIVKEFLPRMDHQPSRAAIKKALMLLNLEEPILRGIHQGYVNETVARDFIGLSVQDRMVLFKIISSLRLSFSNQKKLLNICKELAGRVDKSITALLDNDEVQGILHHRDANPPQKTKNLMVWLSRKHMPRSRQAEEEFSRFLTKIKLPRNISVTHTPFFEDDSLTLSITFPNRKSLQHAWEKIRHATHSNDN